MAFLEGPEHFESRLEPQYRDFYDTWKRNPDPSNAGKLLRAVGPEIDKGITAHVGAPNPLIKSRARMLALRAIRSYDPSQARLGTHIVNQLQGLKRVSRQQSQILPIPERVSLDANHLDRVRNDLSDRLGREPSLTELADETGLSVKRIRYVQKFRHPVAEGTLAHASVSEEGSGMLAPAVESEPTDAWLDLVYGDLEPKNQKIMEWTLGMYGQPVLPNQEIARRLGISSGAVSQRKARIQQLLNQQELNPFTG